MESAEECKNRVHSVKWSVKWRVHSSVRWRVRRSIKWRVRMSVRSECGGV